MSKTELPTVDDNPERCAKCRYWEECCGITGDNTTAVGHDGTPLGRCRRFPPIYTGTEKCKGIYADWILNNWSFPITMSDGWCGEWQAKRIPTTTEGTQ